MMGSMKGAIKVNTQMFSCSEILSSRSGKMGILLIAEEIAFIIRS